MPNTKLINFMMTFCHLDVELFSVYYVGHNMEEDGMGGSCNTHGRILSHQIDMEEII
jgi:hypothetical protein